MFFNVIYLQPITLLDFQNARQSFFFRDGSWNLDCLKDSFLGGELLGRKKKWLKMLGLLHAFSRSAWQDGNSNN